MPVLKRLSTSLDFQFPSTVHRTHNFTSHSRRSTTTEPIWTRIQFNPYFSPRPGPIYPIGPSIGVPLGKVLDDTEISSTFQLSRRPYERRMMVAFSLASLRSSGVDSKAEGTDQRSGTQKQPRHSQRQLCLLFKISNFNTDFTAPLLTHLFAGAGFGSPRPFPYKTVPTG